MEEMDYEKEDIKEEIEKKAGSALSTIVNGAGMVATAFGLLRQLDRYIEPRRALRFLGMYRRRRSFWGSAALFGAGALAGAGIAMFASPMSGRQTRQGVMRGVRSIGRKGRELVKSAGSELREGMGLQEGEQGQKSLEGGNGHDQRSREQAHQ